MVYFITQQYSFVVPALRSLVPGVFMSGNLEILYWQMRIQLISGPLGPMGGWVTREQWMLAEIPVLEENSYIVWEFQKFKLQYLSISESKYMYQISENTGSLSVWGYAGINMRSYISTLHLATYMFSNFYFFNPDFIGIGEIKKNPKLKNIHNI